VVPILSAAVHRAIHTDNVTAGIKRISIIESGKNAVSDLFDDQFLICLSFLATPENAVRMSLHVINVGLGMIVLIVAEGDREAGSYFLCFHTIEIIVNSYAMIEQAYNITQKQIVRSTPCALTVKCVRICYRG